MMIRSIALLIILFATFGVGISIGFMFRGVIQETEVNIITEEYD